MLKNNFKQIRTFFKLSQHAMAEKLEITPAQYNNYERGSRKPSAKVLSKLIEVFNLNLNYLFRGEGNIIYNPNIKTNINIEPVYIKYLEIPNIEMPITKNEDDKDMLFDKKIVINTWNLQPENLKITKMIGNQMTPQINNNDILLIDTSNKHIAEGGVFVYTTKANMPFTSIVNLNPNGNVQLIYNNKLYETFTYTPEELKTLDFNIIGKVIINLSSKI